MFADMSVKRDQADAVNPDGQSIGKARRSTTINCTHCMTLHSLYDIRVTGVEAVDCGRRDARYHRISGL